MDVETRVAEFAEIARAKMLEGFRDGLAGMDALVTTISTDFDGERLPNTPGECDYVDTPHTASYGLTLSLTKETVSQNRVEQFSKDCKEAGYKLGYLKTKRILTVVLGMSRTYCHNGQYFDTYRQGKNDYPCDLDGIPSLRRVISVAHQNDSVVKQILVMPARELHAKRIMASAGQYLAGFSADVIASPVAWQLLARGDTKYAPDFKPIADDKASRTWFAGDFQEAFCYIENWPVTVVQTAPGQLKAEEDILARWKISERGVPAVLNPLKVTRFTP
jgi:hypothetical protein